MSMSAKQSLAKTLLCGLTNEPLEELTPESNAEVLRALSLLAAVEDGDEIVRYLNKDAARLLAKSKQVPSTAGQMKYEELSRKQANAAARITLDAQEKAALKAELESVKAELAAETAIVDRIWDQLGRPSYEELKGRSIYDLIDALKAELASVKAHAEAMADAIQFSDMAILTVAKAAAEAYRAAHPKEGA